jgi:hypothetical protein
VNTSVDGEGIGAVVDEGDVEDNEYVDDDRDDNRLEVTDCGLKRIAR